MGIFKKYYTGNIIQITDESNLVGSFIYEGWFFESPKAIHESIAKNLDSQYDDRDLKIVDFKRIR